MSSPFQDQMEIDLDAVFFNFDEFAEPHTIDGANIGCIKDTDVSQPTTPSLTRREGTYTDKIMLFVKEKDLPGDPAPDQLMTVDNIQYRIINVNLFGGMWEITLEAVA